MEGKAMATITLEYDGRNALAASLIDTIKKSRVFKIKQPTRKKTSFELSQDDIASGRVFIAKNGKDLIEKCLQ